MFVNQLLMIGLVAAVLPVLIHLMMRDKPHPVTIPTVVFIRRALQRTRRRRRLSRILLLAMRVFLVVLLVMMLARPVWLQSPFQQTGKGRAAMAIVLDDSYTMGWTDSGTSRMDRAARLAQRCLDRLAPGSAATLILTSNPVTNLTHDLEFVRRRIQQTEPAGKAGGLRRAIRQADTAFRQQANDLRRVVVVITDANRAVLRPGDGPLPVSENVRLALLPLPARPPAPYLGSVRVEDADNLVAGGKTRVLCVLGGGETLAGRRVTLTVDGRTAAERTVAAVSPTGEARITFPLQIPRVGRLRGEVRIVADDPLKADNSWYFTLRANPPRNILCIGNPDTDTLQVRDIVALAAAPPGWHGRQRFRVDTANHRFGWQEADLDAYDSVLLTGRVALPPEFWQRLQNFVARGGTVLIMPDDTTALPQLNTQALPLLPAPIEYQAGLSPPATLGPAPNSALGEAIASLADGALKRTPFRSRCHLQPPLPPGTDPILEWNDGTIAAAARDSGKGRCLFIGFAPVPHWSPLLTEEAFAPAMHRLLARTALANRPTPADILCGQAATIAVPEVTAAAPLLVDLPDEAGTIRLAPGAGAVHRFVDTDRPGIYVVHQDKEQRTSFAANLARTDDHHRFLAPMELEHLAGPSGAVIADPEEIILSPAEGAGPLPLAPLIALLAALLLPLEAWLGLAHRRHHAEA